MNVSRREFLHKMGLVTGGVMALGTAGTLAACSSDDKKDNSDATENLAALIVSSDLYSTSMDQRFAFGIFKEQSVVSGGHIPLTITSPSGKIQRFKKVGVRDKGLTNQGIYSTFVKLNEVGTWNAETNYKGKVLDLAFSVKEASSAPALGSPVPTGPTPTDADHRDAEILCTRFDGNCGLHAHSVGDLLATKKPFIVLFATPARCQTNYCGPVLDLTRKVAKDFDIPVIHVEIYKNETSAELLDSVNEWHLESEPWMFGISADGKVTSRLDGAFDQSEIEEIFKELSA